MVDQVAEIKQKTDIIELISKYVPSLKKRGRHWNGLCPFHNEKSPSFIVSPELQIYKCFGCGKGGDVFTFLQEYEKIDFKEALEDLAKRAGVVLVKSANYDQNETQKNTLLSINLKLSKFYHHLLTAHPIGKPALDYVLQRGITMETIKEFQMGFSPVDSSVGAKYLLKNNFTSQDIVASGTFNTSSYGGTPYDRFASRLVFPLTDFRGRILGFSGRILPGVDSSKHAKYINSPETPLYHKSHTVFGLHLAKEHIRNEKQVIVVEGEFDMISPYQAGFKNIVAIKGTAFTTEQLQLLKRYTDTLILGLDADFAGNNATLRSISLADEFGFDIRVLRLGDKYKDPDEAVSVDPEFFKNQITKAQPVWDFVIEVATKQSSILTPSGRKNFLQNTLPFITGIKNEVIKQDYLQKIAYELGSDIQAIQTEASKIHTTATSNSTTPIISQKSNTSNQKEYQFLVLILSTKSPSSVYKKNKKQIPSVSDEILQKIWEKIPDYVDAASFQQLLPPELHAKFQEIYLESQSVDMDSETKAKEIRLLVNHLELLSLKEQLKNVTRQMARLESDEGDTDSMDKEYKKLTQRLAELQAL